MFEVQERVVLFAGVLSERLGSAQGGLRQCRVADSQEGRGGRVKGAGDGCQQHRGIGLIL